MKPERVFDASRHFLSAPHTPPRVVITESADAAVVCWQVEPGQHIEWHTHPTGQDTWIVLSGEGLYFADTAGQPLPLRPGVVAVAHRGELHGAVNTGTVPLKFISVVSPSLSGFEPLGLPLPASPG